ncbi:hypothetical protein JHN46_39540, partial [Streptomyces sp. MBT33]|nr:hypothetical protein [Streptomyces sp. MBT33]
MVQAGLTKTQLATRASLGRTTVSEALSPTKGVPSAATVTAMAKVLKQPVEELLELQRTAAGKHDTVTVGSIVPGGPGHPIVEWDPYALEVHPAGPDMTSSGSTPARALPRYVHRPHDDLLGDAVRDVLNGRSRIVVLVGTSSTGKTRACWEAVQQLSEVEPKWRLWHPFDPSRAEAALADLQHVGPRTVVWLNEAQHYLGDRAVGERIAAAVHRLLQSRERKPVLVLGTLWPEYARQYTTLPKPGEEDPHSRVRELLSGHTVSVPDTFTPQDLATAAALAEQGDRLLGEALTRARTSGRVAQDLAGVPQLLNRYEHGSPAAKAVLEAAMDALRLGVGPNLPQVFLTAAARDYIDDIDRGQLTRDWAAAADAAFTELAKPVHGKQAPLDRIAPASPQRPTVFPTTVEPADVVGAEEQLRLADYLEQHGRDNRGSLCPPASFWHAAYTHVTRPENLHNLFKAARQRHRQQWAHHLLLRAAEHGDADALAMLASPCSAA